MVDAIRLPNEWLEAIVDDGGCAFIPCNVPPGPYLIMLEEHVTSGSPDVPPVCISSSIVNLCVSDSSVNTMRACYNIEQRFTNHTLGGIMVSLANEGISLTHCYPSGRVRLYLFHPGHLVRLFRKEDMWQQEKKEILKQLDALRDKLEEIYYAPGMPGFVNAKSDFDASMVPFEG